MMHLPTAMFQKFQQIPQRLEPIFQSQVRPFMRPEDIPTDGADVFDADEDAMKRRKSEQARLAQMRANLNQPLPPLTVAGSASPFSLDGSLGIGSPETRALLSNVFRTALDNGVDTSCEEAPRVAADLANKEYNKQENNRQNGTQTGYNPYQLS